MEKDKIKLGDIVVGIHKKIVTIGKVVGVDKVHKLSSENYKPIKYAYHIRFGGASEGFYKDARKLKKLNKWQADRIKEVLNF